MNATSPPLAVSLALFAALEAAGIRHCHWKSNEHLGAGLAGETDLDVLVDADRAAETDQVLLGQGYRRFRSAAWGRFPGLFDWLGFDHETGRMVHIHLHHQLLTGLRFVKEHHLPWEQAVLDSRVRDQRFGVQVTHPALELVMLLARVALKNTHPVARGLVREFDYLLEGIDFREVEVWAHQILPPADATAALTILLARRHLERGALAEMRRRVSRALTRDRRMSSAEAAVRGPMNRARFAAARLARRLSLDVQLGKRLEPGGALVAVIGCDGAGKSTVAAELARWLAWKVDARTIYLGVGEGRVGVRVRVLRGLARSAEKRTPEAPGPPRPATPGSMPTRFHVPSVMRDVGSGLLNNAMADERMAKLREAAGFRAAGGVLLTDRFPQTQFPGIYDGPRTTRSDHDSALRRAFAGRELRLYESMAAMAPDVVIKLHVPVEVAIGRKPGHDARGIQRKCDLTMALEFPHSAVFDVDAARPLEAVLLDCKRILWSRL